MTLAWGKSTIFRQTNTHLKLLNLLYKHDRVLVLFWVYAALIWPHPHFLKSFTSFRAAPNSPKPQCKRNMIYIQWIGLRENLNRKPWFLPSNIGVSCKFSHHPILWYMQYSSLASHVFCTACNFCEVDQDTDCEIGWCLKFTSFTSFTCRKLSWDGRSARGERRMRPADVLRVKAGPVGMIVISLFRFRYFNLPTSPYHFSISSHQG